MTTSDLYSEYIKRGGYALTPGDFFGEPDLDERRRPAPPRRYAELCLAAQAAGYADDVPAGFLDQLEPEWLAGEPTAWPFADDARAAAYCDLAAAAGLIVEA
jgi:hypothetical protein